MDRRLAIRSLAVSVLLLVPTYLLVPSGASVEAPVCATRPFTTQSDFEQGGLSALSATEVPDSLVLRTLLHDTFPGSALSAAWTATTRDGTATVAEGKLTLAAPSGLYPRVMTGEIIPASDPYWVETRVRFFGDDYGVFVAAGSLALAANGNGIQVYAGNALPGSTLPADSLARTFASHYADGTMIVHIDGAHFATVASPSAENTSTVNAPGTTFFAGQGDNVAPAGAWTTTELDHVTIRAGRGTWTSPVLSLADILGGEPATGLARVNADATQNGNGTVALSIRTSTDGFDFGDPVPVTSGADLALAEFGSPSHVKLIATAVLDPKTGASPEIRSISFCVEHDASGGGGDPEPPPTPEALTGVLAGFGLDGGGTSGNVTLAADPLVLQQRVLGACLAGEAIRVVNGDGTVLCESVASSSSGDGDLADYQRRVATVCGPQSAMRSIDANGNAYCEGLPVFSAGGGLQMVGASLMLQPCTSGQILRSIGAGAWSCESFPAGGSGGEIDFAQVQARVTGVCESGRYVRAVAQDGTVTCGDDAVGEGGGSGDITGIVAGAGLLGGAASGEASVSADFAAVQARVAGSCEEGRYVRAVAADGSVTCGDDAVGNASAPLVVACPEGQFIRAIADSVVTCAADLVGDGGNVSLPDAWLLGGNLGTAPGTHFVGTTDDAPLEFRVNGTTAFRVMEGQRLFGPGYPNIIGGAASNEIEGERQAVIIAGGVGNTAYGDVAAIVGGTTNAANGFAFVGGGILNNASGPVSVVVGGEEGQASGDHSFVGAGRAGHAAGARAFAGGGFGNGALGPDAAVVGGRENNASGSGAFVGSGSENLARGEDSFVGGGTANVAHSRRSAVAGGLVNNASGVESFIGGGARNRAWGIFAAVLGGQLNNASGILAAIGGGMQNLASGDASHVGGGLRNNATGDYATVGGGEDNVATERWTSIGGGFLNRAAGFASSIGGGSNNSAAFNYSIIAGGRNNSIVGDHATIGGGENNVAGGSGAFYREHATVGGGYGNQATEMDAAVAGGWENVASNVAAFVGGGSQNRANGQSSTVSGGWSNAANNYTSTVAGGWGNVADAEASFVGSGLYGLAKGYGSAIVGGRDNVVRGLYSIIGGGEGNEVAGTYSGILAGRDNRAGNASGGDSYAFVGGGRANNASGSGAAIPGGAFNQARGVYSTIGGGRENAANGSFSGVGAGSKNHAVGPWSWVGGGWWNNATANDSTVGGGFNNTARGFAGTIGGGRNNSVEGESAAIGGGEENVASGFVAVVAGGRRNEAFGAASAIAGGAENAASIAAFVGGGTTNEAIGGHSAILGGSNNRATNFFSVVAGGHDNNATGVASFAAGSRANAAHGGTFIWSDQSEAREFGSTARDQFLVRARGGVGIGTNAPTRNLTIASAATGASMDIRDVSNELRLGVDAFGPFVRAGEDETLRVGSSVYFLPNSHVGMGTAAPRDKLDVLGDIRVGLLGQSRGCVKDRDATVIAGTCSSDARLKKDITPFGNVLAGLAKIAPVHFSWRDDAPAHYGFGKGRSFGLIAQEVEKVFPEMVVKDEFGYKAVQYNKLPLLLLQGLNELHVENIELRSKVTALEQRTSDLEARLAALEKAKAEP